jgi:uncharacterized membrane protein
LVPSIGRSLGQSLIFLAIAVLVCATAAPAYAAREAELAAVLGRVVDEYGQGLEGARVEVYSPDGAFIKSISTAQDGSFAYTMSVALAYRVLRFSKEGYVNVTKTVVLSGGETANLGEVVLLKSIRVSSSAISLVAAPGDRLLLPFTVTNIGKESQRVDVSASGPEGWAARVLGQSGYEVARVELAAGGSMSLQLEAVVPPTASGVGVINLTAAGKVASSLSFTVGLHQDVRNTLLCQFPGKAAAPGELVRFQVRLKNVLGVESRFNLSLRSLPPGWEAYIRNAGGEYVTEVYLGSGEYVDLAVEVKPSSSAKVGEEHMLCLEASSYGVSPYILPLKVSLTKPGSEALKLAARFPEVTVEAGKAVQYPITVTNSGGEDRLLLLSADAPADWKIVFKSGVFEVSRLYLEAGKSESLVVEATPPSTVNLGTYTIPIGVRSEDGAVYVERELKATIMGSYGLRLEASTLLTSVATGGSATLTAKITNTGYTPVTGATLLVAVPQGWDSSVSPVGVDLLKPRESYTFTVAVKAPGDAVAGDYLLSLTGRSDQVSSDSIQVRVTVTAPTSWGLIGVGVAVVAVAALISVFAKFRRR